MQQQGQCLLAVIPVRFEPKSQAEIVTQLLYGETYSVLQKTEDWIKIKMDYDGYEGWMSSNQFSTIEFGPNAVVNQPFVKHKGLILSMGSEIELDSPPKTQVESISTLALSLQNSPYLWGGRSFMGIDCSGFIQVIHKVLGIKMPRDASQQIAIGQLVTFGNQEVGDLVFFVNANQRVHHVGMMLSKTDIIHASGSVRIDQLTEEGIVHGDKNIVTHSLFQIKRIR